MELEKALKIIYPNEKERNKARFRLWMKTIKNKLTIKQ